VAFAVAQHHLAQPHPVGPSTHLGGEYFYKGNLAGACRMGAADIRAAEGAQRAAEAAARELAEIRDEPIGALAVAR
jgi:hypothetical protein